MRYLVLVLVLICSTGFLLASEEGHGETLEVKGPHGGNLLEDKEFSIEVTIFEAGVPAEMRLFVYRNGQLLDPKKLKVRGRLDRLGGVVDELTFIPEKDYLVSEQTVVEPHSFDVTLEAEVKNERYHWRYQNHEGRAEISQRLQELSAIETEVIGERRLTISDTLFGVISVPTDNRYSIHAPYQGLVKKLHVGIGETVKKGQRLATLHNTQTLQDYYLNSPVDGEVTDVFANTGDKATESVLLEIIDFSQVWVELSAFPENIERLDVGQKLSIYDLHQHQRVGSKISYIAPQMTGGHIARARALLDNSDGHWRPGMHIKADVEIKNKTVPLAIKSSALQSFREMPVVFAQFENTFEVRMLELGETDGEYIEVLGGIKAGTKYVVGNSFLLKAEVLKDGASHDH